MQNRTFYTRSTIPDFAKSLSKPKPPAKIGSFEVKRLLYKGSLSFLYLAEKKNQEYVLKVFSITNFKNVDLKSRFLQEARILKYLNHPHIIKLIDYGKFESGLFIALEYHHERSLKDFIEKKDYTKDQALKIFFHIAKAVSYLHACHIIHRDLKPENILIAEDLQIKIIDFGISLDLRKRESKFLVMGTPSYMSPEQKVKPHAVSFASDIYSLGVLFYELMTKNICHGDIDDVTIVSPFSTILQKMIEPDQNARYQHIDLVLRDIKQQIQEEKPQSLPLSPLFLPEKFHLPHIDFGMSYHRCPMSTFCFDMFSMPDNQYLMIFFEPLEATIESYLYSAVLRGMVRALIEEMKIVDMPAVKMLSKLNRMIKKDPHQAVFGFSFLLLDPKRDFLSFISLGHNEIFLYPEKQKKPRILMTPNPALGEKKEVTILQTAEHWEPGDLIILQSLYYKSPENLSHYLKNLSGMSAQKIANFLGEQNEESGKTCATFSFVRIF